MGVLFHEHGGAVIAVVVIVALIAILGIILATHGPFYDAIMGMLNFILNKVGINPIGVNPAGQ